MIKKTAAILLTLCLIISALTGCGSSDSAAPDETPTKPAAVTNLPKPDLSKWLYDEQYDIYYLLGVSYCEKPADEKFEKLAIFVPGAYMNASDNGDGTYTCEMNASAGLNGYTAADAPIVMPIDTEGYASAKALTEEFLEEIKFFPQLVSEYTSQGFVYVYAGCRGVMQGAPSGVTDLKAAIRYLRYCDDVIAGDAESIFAFGMSGGGAQAAILGASGDSALYEPYLEAIGAVQGVSDAIAGSMDWCPVTNLATANAEYEWMMGCTREDRTEEEQAISDKLAEAYADYVNSAGFLDEEGNPLTLEPSDHGIYQAGSYYEYLKEVIEHSLNNYLSDTPFKKGTAQEYIDSLNKDRKWVTYNKNTNTAAITSIEDFCKTCKNASDLVVAFDQPPGSNTLFGYGDGEGSHFDRILADILASLNIEYADDYFDDLNKTDFLGNSVDHRVAMYTPLYYLMPSEKGYGTSTVAKYWRIRSGIKQRTNALTTEVNIALALYQYDSVESVDFETVWEQDHTEAERKGDSTANFIEWVHDCMKG